MADAPLDLYTQLHRAIWAALKDYEPFTALVDVRNSLDMTADDFEDFPANTPPDALPEVAVLQGPWSQGGFSTGNVGVPRTQTFAVVITTGHLNPRDMNKLKELFLEALLLKGVRLGLSQPINGTTITGWSVAGDDSLVPLEQTPGEERLAIRSQSVGRVTVTMLKNLPVRPHM